MFILKNPTDQQQQQIKIFEKLNRETFSVLEYYSWSQAGDFMSQEKL